MILNFSINIFKWIYYLIHSKCVLDLIGSSEKCYNQDFSLQRQRIENLSRKRLPKELLKAVVAEREMRPKQKIAIQKSEGKVKTFTDDNVTDSSLVGENIDEGKWRKDTHDVVTFDTITNSKGYRCRK